MKLIDADKLIEGLKECYDDDLQKELEFLDIYEFIKEQPTAYNVDKVVKELKTLSQRACNRRNLLFSNKEYERGRVYAFDDAIDIVKEGGRDEKIYD